MAENVAPSSGANNPGANADATRGVPYYEKLKRDLRETLNKKRLLDKNMVKATGFKPRFSNSILVNERLNTDNARIKKAKPRGSNLPLRSLVPRRNRGGQHHKGLRQLHQRRLDL